MKGRPPAATRSKLETFDDARRRKESALADLRVLEARKRAGELGEVADFERRRGDENRRIRSRLLAVPSRVHARLPHLAQADVRVLDREIRDALAELAGEDDDVTTTKAGR